MVTIIIPSTFKYTHLNINTADFKYLQLHTQQPELQRQSETQGWKEGCSCWLCSLELKSTCSSRTLTSVERNPLIGARHSSLG